MKPLLSKEELADLLSPLGEELEEKSGQLPAQQTHQADQSPLSSTDGSPLLQLRVEAGRCQLSARELLQLARGSLLLLDQAGQDTVEIYLNNQLIGQGKPVLTDNKLAIQLSAVNIPDYLRSELTAYTPDDPPELTPEY